MQDKGMNNVTMLVLIAALVMAMGTARAHDRESYAAEASRPVIVVSLPVLEAPVKALTREWAYTQVLMKPGMGGAHDAAWPPSTINSIARADAVIWVGAGLEHSLAPYIKQHAAAKLYTLMDAAPVGWIAPPQTPTTRDPHFWMSPAVMKQVLAWLSTSLQRDFPAHAASTQAAQRHMEKELDALQTDMEAALAPCNGRELVVLHDGLRYWSGAFGLPTLVALGGYEGAGVSAARMAALKASVKQSRPCCLVGEVDQETTTVKLAAELELAPVTIDTLGLSMQPSATYGGHLRAIAANVGRACAALGTKSQ
jgi:zinc transport system substrate-binding protein